MTAPKPAPCPDKENLLVDLRLAIRWLNDIHAAEIAAAANGNTAELEALQPQLEQAREWRRVIVDSLKQHLIDHGC